MVIVALLVLAGCTVGPNYQRPTVTVPDHYYGVPENATAEVQWADLFPDPVLKSPVDEAVNNGFDARIAAARVEQARARYGIAGSQRYPNVGYQGIYEYGHT
ncbi:MAG TPA: hypothetical protein VGQ44_05515, partial [Gemmatimonadaceae bacterium]|nr:hypothetical protein [Gemmatimonadaceae bacterium]